MGSRFMAYSTSSSGYFTTVLSLQTSNWLKLSTPEYNPNSWRLDVFEGIVSSAVDGSKDLINGSRSALTAFCEREMMDGNELAPETASDYVARALCDLIKKHEMNDRVLVPALETIAFLFEMGIMQNSKSSWKSLYFLVQKAHYKTNNMKKLAACVKVYGGLLSVYPKAMDKLTTLLLHPFPQVRNQAVDEIFIAKGLGKSVNWVHAKKADVEELKTKLIS
jgi:hypothetical protein